MESIIYFLLLAAMFALMMRAGCGAHVMGHRHGGARGRDAGHGGKTDSLRWVPPEKDVDPVCGMTVATAGAKSTVYEGSVYYFCSPGCRDKFEAAPRSFLAHGKPAAPEGEHPHA